MPPIAVAPRSCRITPVVAIVARLMRDDIRARPGAVDAAALPEARGEG